MPTKTTTKHSLFRSANTTTMLYNQLQILKKQKKELTEEVAKVDKEIREARETQSMNLQNYTSGSWAKSIKAQKTAMTEKHKLEQKIAKLDKDIMHQVSSMKTGGGGRNKRKTRKIRKTWT